MGRKSAINIENDENEYVKHMIRIGDLVINPNFIMNMSKEDSYDEGMDSPVFEIIINRTNAETMMSSNLKVPFPTRKVRDDAFDIILNKLEEFKIEIHTII